MAKTKQANMTKTLLGIIGLLVVIIVILSYTLYQQGAIQPSSSSQNSALSLQAMTYDPTPDMVSQKNGMSLFRHPELGYNVAIPSGWTPRIYRTLAGAAVQPYEDIVFLSSDYHQTPSNVYVPVIAQGASIFIRGSETQYTSTRERFDKNPVAKRVAENVKDINVGGVPAIQYEYTLNGENVTNVTLVKNGFWYLIKYQYADENTKNQYWNAFQEVVSSFSPTK